MIPKTLHYCWFGGQPLPEPAIKCINSWKRVMPDYVINRWDESNYDVTKTEYTKVAYNACKYAFVSDYARLDICCEYGGIYLDVDVEVIKPFDDLLVLDAFCGVDVTDCVPYVNTGLVFGCIPNQAMARIMRDDYDTIRFLRENGSYNQEPCPRIQTRLLLKYGFMQNNKKQTVNGLTVFPSDYFAPYEMLNPDADNAVTANTYSIHHYFASWLDPIDKERYSLRNAYTKRYGRAAAQLLSVAVVYKKHYGIIGMIKKTAHKLYEKVRTKI